MLPDYTHNNLVNLMSSILQGFQGKSLYPDLSKLTSQIQEAKNVVLLIIDGLGYDTVQKLPSSSFLKQHLQQKLTTVFPSATAAAITTILSGVAPANHGITGWDMHLAEVASMVNILPYRTYQGTPLLAGRDKIKLPESIFSKINAESHFILKKNLLKSPYNKYMAEKAETCGITNLRSFCSKIKKAVRRKSRKRQFIMAYWGEYDMICHYVGKQHPHAIKYLLQLEKKIAEMALELRKTNTLLLITADHGQITTTRKKTLLLHREAKLKECLTMPLCGETRAAYCYIHPHKQQPFEQYVRSKLRQQCSLHTATELLAEEYFGLGKKHPQLLQRIGDYILLAKENYVFIYNPDYKEKEFQPGQHGGLSEEEMSIPLIKIKL